jgi:hypothetical protein
VMLCKVGGASSSVADLYRFIVLPSIHLSHPLRTSPSNSSRNHSPFSQWFLVSMFSFRVIASPIPNQSSCSNTTPSQPLSAGTSRISNHRSAEPALWVSDISGTCIRPYLPSHLLAPKHAVRHLGTSRVTNSTMSKSQCLTVPCDRRRQQIGGRINGQPASKGC